MERSLGILKNPDALREVAGHISNLSQAIRSYSHVYDEGIPAHVSGTADLHLTRAKNQMKEALENLKLPKYSSLKKLAGDSRKAIDNCIQELDARNISPNADRFNTELKKVFQVMRAYKKLERIVAEVPEVAELAQSLTPLEEVGKTLHALTPKYLDDTLSLALKLFPEHEGDMKPAIELMGYADPERAKMEGRPQPSVSWQENWVLVDSHDAVVGMTGLYTLPGDDKGVVWLNWFGIARENQQVGLGDLLLDETMYRAKMLGYTQMRLWTNEMDAKAGENPAIQFYSKCGFEMKQQKIIDGHDGVIMSKSL